VQYNTIRFEAVMQKNINEYRVVILNINVARKNVDFAVCRYIIINL